MKCQVWVEITKVGGKGVARGGADAPPWHVNAPPDPPWHVTAPSCKDPKLTKKRGKHKKKMIKNY